MGTVYVVLTQPPQYQVPDKDVIGEDKQLTVDMVGRNGSACQLPSTG